MISSSLVRSISDSAVSSSAIASSSAALFVEQKIITTATLGGTFVIDPLNGFSNYNIVPEEFQIALWEDFYSRGFTITDVNDEIATGSFSVPPTIKISW